MRSNVKGVKPLGMRRSLNRPVGLRIAGARPLDAKPHEEPRALANLIEAGELSAYPK